MVTPVVRAARRTFPNAYLAVLCSATAHDVLRHNPHLDQVIPLTYRNLPAWLSTEKLSAVRQLRELNLDWALSLETHPRFLDLVRRAGAARSIAYGNPPGPDGFECATFDRQRHCIENHLRAALPLGVRADGLHLELVYPSELDEVVRQRLTAAGIGDRDCLAGIHAGWGGRKHSLNETRLRSWPPPNFAEVIRWLVHCKGVRVVLTGSRSDRALNEYIIHLSGTPGLNLAGDLSLLETAALIRRLNVYLTVDSGPAHMAAALGTPLVTLWGPGIFEQTAPLAAAGPVRILYRRVHCAPCYGTALMQSCRDNICMKEIQVAEVQETIEQVLTSEQPGTPRVTLLRS